MKINWKHIEHVAKKKYGGHGSISKLCLSSGMSTTYYYASKKRDTISFDKLFAIANTLNLHPGELLVNEETKKQQNQTNEPKPYYKSIKRQHITDGDLIVELRRDMHELQKQLNELSNKLSE